MKKRIIFFLFSFFVCHVSYAQSWMWGKNAIGNGEGYGVASDGLGSCYFCGTFRNQDTLNFSGTKIFNPENKVGGGSMFLAKFDKSGKVLWVNHSTNYGNLAFGNGLKVALYGSKDAYVTASFWDTVELGADTFVLYPKVAITSYVAKYNTNGNLEWSREAVLNKGDSNGLGTYYISVDGQGNAFITGLFAADTAYFGSKYILGNRNTYRPFIAKYDSNGNALWADGAVGHQYIYNDGQGQCVANDSKGNAYITGLYRDTLWFGSFELLSGQVTYGNFFLVKYSPAGSVLWAKQVKKSSKYNGSEGLGVTTDKAGNVYCCGTFMDTAFFGAYTLISHYHSYGQENIFLVKYDSNGNVLWAKQSTLLDTNSYYAWSISSDNHSHLYVNVSPYNLQKHYRIAFGKDTLAINDTADYDFPSFLLKFDSSGTLICSSIIQGGGYEALSNIGSDTSGKYVYYGSSTATELILGKDTLNPFAYPIETPGWTWNSFPFVARWIDCDSALVYTSSPQNIPQTPQVNLYPNPNNGRFTIALRNIDEPAQIAVYNILGEEIYHSKINSDRTEINMGTQPQGIYFYRVLKQTGELIGNGKLIIEK